MSRYAAALLAKVQLLEKLVCIIAFVVMVAVLFADVVSREATAAGIHWAPQIGVWANVFVVMAGFGLASASGAHLRPRFADNWLPDAWNPALEFLQQFFMALFCFVIGLIALRVVTGSYQLGEVEITLFWPIWPAQAMLPLAFFLGAIRHLLYAFFPDLRPGDTGAFEIKGAGA
ncbi:MAG: TRAP transporter small permease subunit [Woeseiaceae bacterium]|nr:TRAP transporter small permease subunit [Woeseiaceae bacterium]